MGMRGTIIKENDAGWTLKQMKFGSEKGLEAAVFYWHRNYAPDHFTVEASQRYGYQKRSGEGEPERIPRAAKGGKWRGLKNNRKYYWDKWRRKKEKRPLVYTGASRRQILRSIRVSTRRRPGSGSFATCTGAMDAPKYFYQYDKSKGAPDKYAELIKTTPAEDETLLRVYNQTVFSHLRTMPTRREVISARSFIRGNSL